MTTALAGIASFLLVKKGFEYVMEKTVSYFAKQKLQAILDQLQEEAKIFQENQGIANQTDVKPHDPQQPAQGKAARRRIKRSVGEGSREWQSANEDVVTGRWD